MSDRKGLFQQRVIQSEGCWTHTGSLGSHGYPQATGPYGWSGPAHRVYWLLFVGPIEKGLMVLHRCNNKHCVRPDHLRLGTHKDNMQDVTDGQYHPKRKLSQEDARAVRASTETQRVLAVRYGVTQMVIYNILVGRTYREPGVPLRLDSVT